jgi:hypothetical protein
VVLRTSWGGKKSNAPPPPRLEPLLRMLNFGLLFKPSVVCPGCLLFPTFPTCAPCLSRYEPYKDLEAPPKKAFFKYKKGLVYRTMAERRAGMGSSRGWREPLYFLRHANCGHTQNIKSHNYLAIGWQKTDRSSTGLAHIRLQRKHANALM